MKFFLFALLAFCLTSCAYREYKSTQKSYDLIGSELYSVTNFPHGLGYDCGAYDENLSFHFSVGRNAIDIDIMNRRTNGIVIHWDSVSFMSTYYHAYHNDLWNGVWYLPPKTKKTATLKFYGSQFENTVVTTISNRLFQPAQTNISCGNGYVSFGLFIPVDLGDATKEYLFILSEKI